MSIDASTGVFSWTPTEAQGGTTPSVTVSVTDGSLVDSETFDLSVLVGFNEALYAVPTASVAPKRARLFQANDGIDDDAGNAWVAGNAGPSWIQLDFDSTKSIYRVVLNDLFNVEANIAGGNIEFSDNTTMPFGPLPVDGSPMELIFDAKETNSLRVNVTSTTGALGNHGLAEIAAYSSLDPGQTEVARDLFNDGDAVGWTVVTADCERGNASWDAGFSFFPPDSGADNQYQQTGKCGGLFAEGVESGSYSLLDGVSPPAGLDIRLSLRADDLAASPGGIEFGGTIGIMFGYQDGDNYYRLDLSKNEGHRKLVRRVAGEFTELNTSPQSYEFGGWDGSVNSATFSAEGWINLRVVHKNNVIIVYLDDTKVLAAEDATFSGGQVALWCARNQACTFDDVVILDAPSDPIVGANIIDGVGHASGEYFVTTALNNLIVSAAVTESTGFDHVEFVFDEGGPNEVSIPDPTAPYSVDSFNMLFPGQQNITVYLRDASNNRLTASSATHTLPSIGIEGIHLVGIGDSITTGVFDDVTGDNISLDGRNTSGGYPSLLNNHLTTGNGTPVTILNEGNRGEAAIEAHLRIADVVARHPAAQGFLIFFGANDSDFNGASGIASGLGDIAPNTVNPVTFKDAMQKIIDTIVASGKKVYLAKAPPYDPRAVADTARDLLIQEYNDVIDELVTDNSLATPPDFHTHFSANSTEFYDTLHPNGAGYISMANLWCSALNGQDGLICNPLASL